MNEPNEAGKQNESEMGRPPLELAALLERGGRPLACAREVLEAGWLGLYDVVTHPEWHCRGLARRVMAGLLAWAEGAGAERAYLQVASGNAPAQALIERLGFTPRYAYWYRIQNPARSKQERRSR